MTEKRYLRERVYLVRQKLGGLEVSLKWPLPEGKKGAPEFLSFRLMGRGQGKLRAAHADLPAGCISAWLALKEQLQAGKLPENPVLSFQGTAGADRLWFLELHFLGESFLKPWEFCLSTAEGTGELVLSEPIRVRISGQTMGNLLDAVASEDRLGPNFEKLVF